MFVALSVAGLGLAFAGHIWPGGCLLVAGLIVGIATLVDARAKTYRYIENGTLKRDTMRAILRLQASDLRAVMQGCAFYLLVRSAHAACRKYS